MFTVSLLAEPGGSNRRHIGMKLAQLRPVLIPVAFVAIVAMACGAAPGTGGSSTPTSVSPPPTTTLVDPSTTIEPTTTAPPAPTQPSTTTQFVAKKDRREVFIGGVDVLLMESFPVQVAVQIMGSKPTPCHQLAWIITGPSEAGVVGIEMFTVVDEDTICIQVLEPFEENITLGSFTSGDYVIIVNGERFPFTI